MNNAITCPGTSTSPTEDFLLSELNSVTDVSSNDFSSYIGSEISLVSHRLSVVSFPALIESTYSVDYKRCYAASLDSPECDLAPAGLTSFTVTGCTITSAA